MRQLAGVTIRGFTALFSCVLMSNGSLAACDPNEILRSNVTSYQSNLLVWLAYVNNDMKSTDSNNRGSVGVSYGNIGLSLDEANSLSQFVSQQKQLSLSEQQTVSVLKSTLSPDSVKAYIACLGADRGVNIIVPDAALNEPAFQFTVKWDPNFAASGDQLSILALNGTIIGDSNVPIKPTESKPFIITRDLTKTLFLTAQVHGQTDIISMPAEPQFTMKIRVRHSPPFELIRDGGHGSTVAGSDVCISASDDAILLPSTMAFEGTRGGPQGRSVVTPLKDRSNSVTACSHYEASTGDNDVQVRIAGDFIVQEVYLEPLK